MYISTVAFVIQLSSVYFIVGHRVIRFITVTCYPLKIKCILLYCIVLYCVVSYRIVSYRTVLYCTIFHPRFVTLLLNSGGRGLARASDP